MITLTMNAHQLVLLHNAVRRETTDTILGMSRPNTPLGDTPAMKRYIQKMERLQYELKLVLDQLHLNAPDMVYRLTDLPKGG